MKVKDLIEQLKKLPQESNISLEGKDFHIAVKYYSYEEDLKVWCWSVENQIDFYLRNRILYPEKVRFRLEKNDEDFYKYNKEE